MCLRGCVRRNVCVCASVCVDLCVHVYMRARGRASVRAHVCSLVRLWASGPMKCVCVRVCAYKHACALYQTFTI